MTFLLLSVLTLTQTPSRWVLDSSTVRYHVSHPLHQVDGVSHGARGKGVCQARGCEFLIAVPIRSFDSGDSNRDLHMLQTVRGGQFPIVTVRTQLPEGAQLSDSVYADLEIEFAGQTAHYARVPFHVVMNGNEARVSGTIPATIADFKIDPPSLLTIPIKNDIPVYVESTWHREK
ncbi:MAG TPA: hypothetical protein VGV12_16590 [Gemmatimonadales bacterium]|nr:hypothetical protein [Gemmatimonadales bacterium]